MYPALISLDTTSIITTGISQGQEVALYAYTVLLAEPQTKISVLYRLYLGTWKHGIVEGTLIILISGLKCVRTVCLINTTSPCA